MSEKRNATEFSSWFGAMRESAYEALRAKALARGFTPGQSLWHKHIKNVTFTFDGVAPSSSVRVKRKGKREGFEFFHHDDLLTEKPKGR